VAWTLYALVLWLWHLPVAYDAARRSAGCTI
jgi:cytochrome c oxidase assembly factor CtaG